MKSKLGLSGPTQSPSQKAVASGGGGWRSALRVWIGGASLYGAFHLGFWWLTGKGLSYAPFFVPFSFRGFMPEPVFVAFFGLESIAMALLYHGLLRALGRGERGASLLKAHRMGFLAWLVIFLIFTTRAQPYLIDKAPSNFFLLGYSVILPPAVLLGAWLLGLLMRFADEARNNLVFALLILAIGGLSVLALHYRLRLFWDLARIAKAAGILLTCLAAVGAVGILALGRARGQLSPRFRTAGNLGLGMAVALSVAGVLYAAVFLGPEVEGMKAAQALNLRLQSLETMDQPEKGIGYFTIGQETREALFAYPRQEGLLNLEVDGPGTISVGFGARMDGPGEARVSFELSARQGADDERMLLSETVSVAQGASAWHDRVVDLSSWVGKEVGLWFRIRPLSGQEHLSAAWSTLHPTSPTTGAASRPHVILISLDTLRADHLTSWGYRRSTTPNVDALARRGVRFARHFANASHTLSSHMSMMTGRFTTDHLVGIPQSPTNRLDPAIPTLAEILKELGYFTVAVTGGNWVSPEWFKRGFHRFRIPKASMYEHLWDLEENLEAVRRLLEDNQGERLFLFFHTYKPHSPYMGRFFLIDEGIEADPKDLVFPYNDVEVALALYDGDIKTTDTYIGLLLKLLEENGVLQNAVVVLTSDHGEAFGEHGNRGHGNSLFDEELHVPLILFYPPRVPEGRTVEALTSSVDILPTVLDLLDIPPPDGLDGESLRPLWSEEKLSGDGRLVVLGQARQGNYSSALGLRTERYKLIGFSSPDGDRPRLDPYRTALYDLEADPGERVNRLSERPSVSRRLGKALEEAFGTQEVNITAARQRSDALEISRERVEQLKALGYLQ